MNEIKCPGCGHVFDDEQILDFISYWGDEGPTDSDCPECETPLTITENVERTFEVSHQSPITNHQSPTP